MSQNALREKRKRSPSPSLLQRNRRSCSHPEKEVAGRMMLVWDLLIKTHPLTLLSKSRFKTNWDEICEIRGTIVWGRMRQLPRKTTRQQQVHSTLHCSKLRVVSATAWYVRHHWLLVPCSSFLMIQDLRCQSLDQVNTGRWRFSSTL